MPRRQVRDELLANCHHRTARNLECGKIKFRLWSGNVIFYCQTSVLPVPVHHRATMTSSGELDPSQGQGFMQKIPEGTLKNILAHGGCITKAANGCQPARPMPAVSPAALRRGTP